jgi:hypothetical protein
LKSIAPLRAEGNLLERRPASAHHQALSPFLRTMATEPQQPPDDEENERDRRTANIFLLAAAILVVGGGIWLVNAMVDARNSEECFESGRRNCNPIDVSPRDRE